METKWKTAVLANITEAYLNQHGVTKIDWTISYYAQPLHILSCIDDIAVIAKVRGNSKGWSRSHVLYERISKFKIGL